MWPHRRTDCLQTAIVEHGNLLMVKKKCTSASFIVLVMVVSNNTKSAKILRLVLTHTIILNYNLIKTGYLCVLSTD